MLLLIKYFFRLLLGLLLELDTKKLIAKLSSLLKLYLEWWGDTILDDTPLKFITGYSPLLIRVEEKEQLIYSISLNKKLSSNNSLLEYN